MKNELQPHIQCRPEDITPYVLLPGDPARVDLVAAYLTSVRKIAENREYRMIRGWYREVPITVMSTGMGGVSVAIGVEELVRCGARYGIRIGSAGALQPEIKIGDLVIAEAAVRDEGTSQAYQPLGYPAVASPDVFQALMIAAKNKGTTFHSGIIRSHDSFYRDDENEISQYWHKRGILASEMETAALFVVGRTRGMKVGSILNVVVEYGGELEQGIQGLVNKEVKVKEGEIKEILVALEALYTLHQLDHENAFKTKEERP